MTRSLVLAHRARFAIRDKGSAPMRSVGAGHHDRILQLCFVVVVGSGSSGGGGGDYVHDVVVGVDVG